MNNTLEEFISQANTAKNLTGLNAQDALEGLLQYLQEQGIILGYSTELGSRNDIAQPHHYGLYAPFLITLNNGNVWALYSTTSIRDRIKQQHWDSLLVKRYYYIEISKCYLIYPDSVSAKEKRNFINANEKIQDIINHQNNLDELDGIISQTELVKLLMLAAYENMQYGTMQDSRGRIFEKTVASILKDEHNIARWNGDRLESGNQYPLFVKFYEKFGCTGKSIKKVITKTGNELGKLPTGGAPKTDVLVSVEFEDCSSSIFTISCKLSSKEWVSAHEYSAKSFVDALSINEEQLVYELDLFQNLGGETLMPLEDREVLKEKLKPYVKGLTEWVITGKHGSGDPITQVAKYVAIGIDHGGTTDTIHIYTAEEYIDLVLETTTGQFGTPFKWTYPSKKKGEKIQLKMKTITKKDY